MVGFESHIPQQLTVGGPWVVNFDFGLKRVHTMVELDYFGAKSNEQQELRLK